MGLHPRPRTPMPRCCRPTRAAHPLPPQPAWLQALAQAAQLPRAAPALPTRAAPPRSAIFRYPPSSQPRPRCPGYPPCSKPSGVSLLWRHRPAPPWMRPRPPDGEALLDSLAPGPRVKPQAPRCPRGPPAESTTRGPPATPSPFVLARAGTPLPERALQPRPLQRASGVAPRDPPPVSRGPPRRQHPSRGAWLLRRVPCRAGPTAHAQAWGLAAKSALSTRRHRHRRRRIRRPRAASSV
mmetsp:Transcript_33667/g.96668  ORF Transcript_33667/g.96668 Transcript_33667/m.96668 type:complete len:239 (-) Transcript_33667:250-966(-)